MDPGLDPKDEYENAVSKRQQSLLLILIINNHLPLTQSYVPKDLFIWELDYARF
jgi:hypothetical protein